MLNKKSMFFIMVNISAKNWFVLLLGNDCVSEWLLVQEVNN
jgi:hypothetical protein